LFSHTKITGSESTAAIFAASWNAPMLAAPSPKNETATESSPRYQLAKADPTAIGMPAPTTPFAPSMPSEVSLMCMLPPIPPQDPVDLPNSSAYIAVMSAPLAMACPCPRWVEVTWSSGPSTLITPTATAS
jgi:hypothetical protein